MNITQIPKCTGCELCVNVCNRGAIRMHEDSYGFLYPVVDDSLCVRCGQCEKKCPANNSDLFPLRQEEPKAYAAMNRNRQRYMKGSSGGVFSALAEWVIQQNGAVFGAAWDRDLNVMHVCAEDEEALEGLFKSKYIQSRIGHVYSMVQMKLEEGKYVLFSGTPCQVAALRSYLGKEYEKLYCVDVVCHGVPNSKMFHSYLAYSEASMGKIIERYEFRGKVEHLGNYNSFQYTKKGISTVPWQCDPYVYFFMYGQINRESCFSCKYANENRLGDITLSDYWGYKGKHADFPARCGISLVLVNTTKGALLYDRICPHLKSEETEFVYAVEHNAQLKQPATRPEDREKLLDGWKSQGFSYLDREFRMRSDKRYTYRIKLMLVKIYDFILHKRLFPEGK